LQGTRLLLLPTGEQSITTKLSSLHNFMTYFQNSEQVLRSRLEFIHILKTDEDWQRWSDSIVRLVRKQALESYRSGMRDARPRKIGRHRSAIR
jgi:hypothetical protein